MLWHELLSDFNELFNKPFVWCNFTWITDIHAFFEYISKNSLPIKYLSDSALVCALGKRTIEFSHPVNFMQKSIEVRGHEICMVGPNMPNPVFYECIIGWYRLSITNQTHLVWFGRPMGIKPWCWRGYLKKGQIWLNCRH